jgi:hypothetical protein
MTLPISKTIKCDNMTKEKPIYFVYIFRKGVLGMQPVKASTKKEAKMKIKKRYKKVMIIDCEKAIDPALIFIQMAF